MGACVLGISIVVEVCLVVRCLQNHTVHPIHYIEGNPWWLVLVSRGGSCNIILVREGLSIFILQTTSLGIFEGAVLHRRRGSNVTVRLLCFYVISRLASR